MKDGNSTLTGSNNEDAIAGLIPIENVGSIRGVRLSNIHVRNAGSIGCSITGLEGHPVEDVTLTNITVHHRGGIAKEKLPLIEEAMKDEKEKEYPESTMWGNLPARGFYIRHARNISFSNIEISTTLPDARPDFVRVDCE
jgi:hypothetical protein